MICSNNTSKVKDNEPIYEVVRLRLYPTPLQEQRLLGWLDSLRWLYNHCLAWRKQAYQEDKVSITHRQQRDALPQLKKQHPCLAYLPSQVTQDCVARLDLAYQHFFRRVAEKKQGAKVKAGYPRFKKYGSYSSLTYTQVWMTKTKKDGAAIRQKTLKELIQLRTGQEYRPEMDEKPFVVQSGELV